MAGLNLEGSEDKLRWTVSQAQIDIKKLVAFDVVMNWLNSFVQELHLQFRKDTATVPLEFKAWVNQLAGPPKELITDILDFFKTLPALLTSIRVPVTNGIKNLLQELASGQTRSTFEILQSWSTNPPEA